MAYTKSALKRLRTGKLKCVVNKSKKSMFSTAEKKFRAAVDAKEVDNAKEAFKACVSRLDKNAKTGVFHKNKADRKKAQLQLLLNTLEA